MLDSWIQDMTSNSVCMPEDVNIKFDEYSRDGWELLKKDSTHFFWVNLTVSYTAFFEKNF